MFHDFHTSVRDRDFASKLVRIAEELYAAGTYPASDLRKYVQDLPPTRRGVIAVGVHALEHYSQAIAENDARAQRVSDGQLEAAAAALSDDDGWSVGLIVKRGLERLWRAWERRGHNRKIGWMLPCEFDDDLCGIPVHVVGEPVRFGPSPMEFLDVFQLYKQRGDMFVSDTGDIRVELPVLPGRPFLSAVHEFLQSLPESYQLRPLADCYFPTIAAEPTTAMSQSA